MAKQIILKLKKSGRVCYPFPIESPLVSQIAKGYTRVLIPFTEAEKRNSNKKCHIQVVKDSHLEQVKEHRLRLSHA